MVKKYIFGLFLLFIMACSCPTGMAGEKAFSWTYAPGKGDNIALNLNPYSIGKYLAQCQVNRPEIANEVKILLEKGEYYRKRTKDQKGNPTLLTVYVDPDYMLHVVTNRKEDCAACNGTGKRAAPFENKTAMLSVQFRCLECNGEGKIPNKTVEKYFMLSSEDFDIPEEGRKILSQRAYAAAPDGAEEWVEKLVSKDPNERLAACVWLDQNYVRTGGNFQDIMPMLKKARYYDSNEKKKIMVWQFWAGRDLANEGARAFYRIYADTKTGKITKKGFYSGR